MVDGEDDIELISLSETRRRETRVLKTISYKYLSAFSL